MSGKKQSRKRRSMTGGGIKIVSPFLDSEEIAENETGLFDEEGFNSK